MKNIYLLEIEKMHFTDLKTNDVTDADVSKPDVTAYKVIDNR